MSEKEPPRLRDILGENIKALKKARKLPTVRAIEQATGGHLGKSAIARSINAESGTSVDGLEALARAFKVQPWQLLVEGLNPEQLPELTNTPVLEQIRSMVEKQRAAVHQTVDASAAKKSAALQSVSSGNTKPDRHPAQIGPALKGDLMVAKGASGATGTNAKGGGRSARVRQSKSRRNP